jgi:hypothetical protein
LIGGNRSEAARAGRVATVLTASGQTLMDPAATTEPFLFYRAVGQ